MSKKNQNNDDREESLTDEQNDISSNEPELEDEHASEDTINTVEEIEEIYEEIADESSDVDAEVKADQQSDQQTDQGFEQKPVAPTSDDGSGGKGMAGTAMGLSLLALAGTGYNLYDSNSGDSTGSEQEVVDYSGEIASIQEQIQSLMQSQEELTAMSTSMQSESETVAEQAGEVAAADEQAATTDEEVAAADDSVSAEETTDTSSGQDVDTSTASTDETTSDAGETATVETTGESTSEASDQSADESTDETDAESTASDEQADETQAVVEQETDEAGSGDAEMADTADSDTAASDTEVADTDTTDAQATETDVAESETTTADSTETQQADSDQAAETDSQAGADMSALADSAQQQIQQAQADALASLPSGDDIKQMALEQVSVVLDDAKKRLGLNEVAQLLSIGEQRLALAGDIGAAQAAFSMADQRLSEISDPAIDPVRESIGSNLAALENLEVVDKNALTQELTSISGSIDTLAFKPLESLSESVSDEQGQADSSADASEASGESTSGDASLSLEGAGAWLKSIGSKVGDTIGDVGSGIAGDLKGMVTIQKTGPLSDVLLAPEQQYFIRENIKLQLASAQRAVLQDNTGVYKQSLTQSQSMLNDFFDTENEDVQSVSTRLQDLEQINLELEIPDVSAASASLGEVIKQLPAVGSSETNSN